jgi:hypothetical protein
MIWRLRYLVLSSERKTEAVGNSRCARVLHSIETASPSAGRQRDLLRRSLLTQHRLISAMADLNPPLFLGVLLLTACTAATSPSLHRVTELVPGISTQDDAIAKLGPPSSSSNVGNSTILQWGGNNSPVHLAISFGMDGRMIQVATDAQNLGQLSGVTQ